MTAAFDHVASDYDRAFTLTSVGALQRGKVWDYLDQVLPADTASILELNCGTGEDALFMGRKGHRVWATDASTAMLDVAISKATEAGMEKRISFLHWDLNRLESAAFKEGSFDVVFSNFGGLNCLEPAALESLGEHVARLLKPRGHLIAVVMPSFCLWETCYFLGKLQAGKAFRRLHDGPVAGDLHGAKIPVWYYSPANFAKICGPRFRLHHLKPVGFTLPPTYLQSFFSRHSGLLGMMDRLENRISRRSWIARYSDHYLIDLELT